VDLGFKSGGGIGLGEEAAGGEARGEGRGRRGGKGGLQETATGKPGCGHAGNHRRREWAEARWEFDDETLVVLRVL
jgi:hypothetical protein